MTESRINADNSSDTVCFNSEDQHNTATLLKRGITMGNGSVRQKKLRRSMTSPVFPQISTVRRRGVRNSGNVRYSIIATRSATLNATMEATPLSQHGVFTPSPRKQEGKNEYDFKVGTVMSFPQLDGLSPQKTTRQPSSPVLSINISGSEASSCSSGTEYINTPRTPMNLTVIKTPKMGTDWLTGDEDRFTTLRGMSCFTKKEKNGQRKNGNKKSSRKTLT